MSRTYRKYVKCGVCYGSNTEYYRERNRKERAKNRHHIRNLIANNDIETVNDLAHNIIVPYDDWDEPTDGTYLISRRSKTRYSENFWNRKLGKYLKNKHSR